MFKIWTERTNHTVHLNLHYKWRNSWWSTDYRSVIHISGKCKNFILISKLLFVSITCIYLKLFVVINKITLHARWISGKSKWSFNWYNNGYSFMVWIYVKLSIKLDRLIHGFILHIFLFYFKFNPIFRLKIYWKKCMRVIELLKPSVC